MEWIKNHKLTALLILLVVYLLLKDRFQPMYFSKQVDVMYRNNPNTGMGMVAEKSPMSLPSPSFVESTSPDRILIKESSISLLVKDVNATGEKITAFAKSNDGYMVNASYTKSGESPFGSITIRVPTNKLDQTLSFIRSQGIKVTSENLIGTDVTQEYSDLAAKETTLQKTKTRLEELLDKSTQVQDIVSVQREILTVQDQLDSIKGQKQALEQGARLTRISAYLSTDELALPYAPDNTFRPAVIFKQAVRSLVNTIRGLGELAIWAVVYSPLWGGATLLYIIFKRWKKTS